MLLFLLKHAAVLTITALLSYALGRRVLQRVTFHSASEAAAACTTLGLALLSQLVFVLGIAGVLTRPALIACLGIVGLIASPSIVQLLRALRQWRASRSRSRNMLELKLLALAFLAVTFYLALYPPVAWDAVAYHLPAANAYAQSGRIAPNEYLRFPVFPQQLEMLYAALLLCASDLDTQVLHWFCALLSGLWIFAYGSRVHSVRAGALASAVLFGNPILIWLATTAYIDLGLMLFATAGSLAFLLWHRSRERTWLLLSAVFLGTGAGCKYLGLSFCVMVAGAVLVLSVRSRRLSDFARFAGLGLAFGAPWYVYNFVHAGNPLFPFFDVFAANRYWSRLDVENQMAAFGRLAWRDLVKLPWRLVVWPASVSAEGQFSPLCAWLWVLPLSLWKRVPQARAPWLIAAGFTALVLIVSPLPRYLMAMLPLLSLAVGITLARCLPLLGSRVLTFFACGIALALSVRKIDQELRWRGKLPVTAEQSNQYVELQIPQYAVLRRLTADPAAARVYGLFAQHLIYYSPVPMLGDWFGPAHYDLVYDFDALRLREPSEVHARLSSLGVTHLLVCEAYDQKGALPDEAAFAQWFRTVAQGGPTYLFALR